MLISSSIPNFANGISQQPFTLRLASQGELQENGLSTVSQGLKKRPPTQHLKKIQSTPLADAFIHMINRDETEKYVVIITTGDLKVYDLAGNEKTVAFPNGKAYLTTTTASTSFAAMTVADHTFFVNKTVSVLSGTTTVAARPYEALVNIKAGNYGKTYKIIINGTTVASKATLTGSTTADSTDISTDKIATDLVTSLAASGITTANGWTVTLNGSCIYISKAADFTIVTEDGFNNNAMVAIKGKLQKFTDLPNAPRVSNFTVEIVGDASSAFDNYWVRFDSTVSPGVWRETIAPTTVLGLNASTMPYVLVREASGGFTFKQGAWADRTVGDILSSPNPSFIGRKINDIFFYRNRLGLLSDEAVIFSEAGSYFNMFRSTAIDLLDSDPIDVNASHTKVSILSHAIPFNKQLLLFSEQTQFVIDQNELLTPRTVGIKQTTDFPCNVNAKPVGAGKNVYFAVNKGNWSGMREFFTSENNAANDSTDITAHVPKYIPSGVYKIAQCPTEDCLAVLTTLNRSSVYIYKYFWSTNEKLQSAWAKWTFPSTESVLAIDFIQSEMFMVVNRPTGVFFEKVDMTLASTPASEPYSVLLDRKMYVSKSALTYANSVTTIPTSALGYVPDGGDYQAVIPLGQSRSAGQVLNVTVTDGVATIAGNYTNTDLVFGRKYLFRYGISTITVKAGQAAGGSKSDTEGRLQLRKVSLNYADTGYFSVKVTPENRPTYTYIYSGKVLGTSSATIGMSGVETGKFVFPIISRNIGTTITLENDSPVPCAFLSADWEGFYSKRSQGV